VVQLDGVMEMTDKELIKLAAKAAGISKQWGGSLVDKENPNMVWNPLTDDGDALRLAVKLGMGISFGQYAPLDVYSVYISKIEHGDEIAVGCITDGDEFGVVRRAIVRAAAQIGKEME
jgi:hypothetical protein